MDFSPLFTPYSVGPLTLPNRFIMPAMQRELSPGGVPSEEMARHYRERVEGGVSLVIGEATAVDHPTSTHYWKYARLTGPSLDGWKRVRDAVKDAGGALFIQLWHEGAVRKEGEGPHPDVRTISPSGRIQASEPVGRAMAPGDLVEIKDAFLRGARTARELGVDGIEIHCAHGYLFDQFLWGETNARTDGYGGDHVGRTRYPCEVISAIRSEVGPDFPISARISQWKERNFDGRIADTPDQLHDILAAFRTAGVDVFHASTRRFWTPEFEGSDLGFAGWVKSLTDASVITVGSVGLDNDIMASLYGEHASSTGRPGLQELLRRFRNNEFDLVAVGRSILGDPNWVRKVREGRFDELRPFTKADLAFLT
ncbi:MAG: 12-oxophytodienoate reductase [Caulobacteraceae bacterium]|jgi:2,4-dienoyl-CoA reductase-like NADH-dependent reductase (Old Yellow Enzyme family)|nr:12-oxophytodienoate reductase [Caulobacteraceae bacterium]